VDFSKTGTIDQSPAFINGAALERVTSFKFSGLNTTEDYTHLHCHWKGAATSLFSFYFVTWWLKKARLPQKHLVNVYRCAGKSVLTYCITSCLVC